MRLYAHAQIDCEGMNLKAPNGPNPSAALAAALIDDCNQALIALSVGGAVLRWNRGATTVFGFSSEEAVGRDFAELIAPSPRQEELRGRLTL